MHQDSVGGVSRETAIALVVGVIFFVVVAALIYRFTREGEEKRSAAAAEAILVAESSECGRMDPASITAVGQNVLAMGDGQKLCAYNFITNMWVTIKADEKPPEATKAP